MEITLEKIELVKDRTGVSYKEAKEALEAADGSVVDAIIGIEEAVDEGSRKSIADQKDELTAKLKDIVKKGNVSKIIIKKDDEVILNIPVNVGIIGAIVAPFAMIAGVAASFGFKCQIEVVKDDGEVVDLSGKAIEKYDTAKGKGTDIYENIKKKASQAKEDGIADTVKDKANAAKDKAGDAFDVAKDKAGDAFDYAMSKINKDEDEDINIDLDNVENSDTIDDIFEEVKEEVKEDIK